MKMKFGGLICPACGGELELVVSADGMSEEAKRYDTYSHSIYSPDWEWVVAVECTNCPRVYEICRTVDWKFISEIK